jgi:multiple sugar transport system substrate-binding protein
MRNTPIFTHTSAPGTGVRARYRRLLALLATFALVATACGGDDAGQTVDGDENGDQQAATAGEPHPDLSDEQVQRMEELGLDASRPYEGTELNFLICCHDAPQFATLIDHTEEFTELTGIDVVWGDVPYQSFQDRLTAEVVTGGGAYDVVAWIDAWGPSIRAGLLPLDDLLAQSGRSMDEFPASYAEVVTAGDPDGRTMGLPLRGHPFMSFYRGDVLDEHGLEVPETWDEYFEMAETIAEEGDLAATAQYYGITGGQNTFNWVSLLWSGGGDIFNEDMEPVFNEPDGVEATERYMRFIRDDLTPQSAVSWGESEALTEFVEGRVAAFNGWWWMYGNMQNPEVAVDEVQERTIFAPAPVEDAGQESVTYTYLWPMGILEESRNQEAAWEYLQWVVNPVTEKEVLMASGDPGGSTHLSTFQDPEVIEEFDGLHEVAIEILEAGRSLPLIPEWPEVNSILEVAINDMAGGADIQQTLDRAAEEVRSLLDQQGYYS